MVNKKTFIKKTILNIFLAINVLFFMTFLLYNSNNRIVHSDTPKIFDGLNTFKTKDDVQVLKGTKDYDALNDSFSRKGVVWEYNIGDEIILNKTIDLSDNSVNVSGNTGTTLIEYYGYACTTEAIIVLRISDYDNPNNYFDIFVSDYSTTFGYIAAAGSNQSQLCFRGKQGTSTYSILKANQYPGEEFIARGWGLYRNTGLSGYNDNTVRLYFDPVKNAVYTKINDSTSDDLYIVRDFDEVCGQSETSKQEAWSGLVDSSKVNLSLRATNGSGAIVITNVDGESFDYSSSEKEAYSLLNSTNKYAYKGGVGNIFVSTPTNLPTLYVDDITTNTTLDGSLFFPNLYVRLENNNYLCDNFLYTEKNTVIFNESGKYSIKYYENNTSEKPIFTLEGNLLNTLITDSDLDGLFISNNGVYTHTSDGLVLEFTLGTTFTFNNTIFLADNDNDDILIQMKSLLPDLSPTINSYRIKTMFLTLTDAYDEDNYVSFRIESNAGNNTIIKAKSSTENDYAGYDDRFDRITYGTWAIFDYSFSNTKADSFTICYDFLNNTFHGLPKTRNNTYIRNFSPKRGVDSESYFENKIKSWSGFKTGEVKLKIQVTEFNDGCDSAKLLITNIDGQSFVDDGSDLYSISANVSTAPMENPIIGVETVLPIAKTTQVVYGDKAFTGKIEISKDGILKDTLTYTNNLKYTFTESGSYILTYRGSGALPYSFNLIVYPKATIINSGHGLVKIGEDSISNNDIVDVIGSVSFELIPDEGYGLHSVIIDGNDKSERIDDNSFILSYTDLLNIGTIEFKFVNYHKIVYHTNPMLEDMIFNGNSIDNLYIKEKEGYNFIGYYMDESFVTPFNNTQVINENINLYPKYELINYTITYELGTDFITSTISTEGDTIFNAETAKLNLKTASLDGYKFIGWSYYGMLVLDAKTLPYNNVKLYAVFERSITEKYKIEIIIDDNTKKIIEVEKGKSIPYELFESAGLNFSGLYKDSAGNIEYDYSSVNEDLVLYAKWNDIIDTVKTNENSIEFVDNTVTEAPIKSINVLNVVLVILSIVFIALGITLIVIKIGRRNKI